MSDYQHHLFISYRRSDKLWVRWANENFAEPLQTFLRASVDDLKVFIDQNIETGSSWPDRLAQGLARSRLLIPLLSRAYFQSEWCRLELALMFQREQQCQFRCPGNDSVLIIPFVYDDGECFPVEVRRMQPREIHDYANPYVRADTPSFESFSELLRQECPRILEALNKVPPFNPDWEQISHSEFEKLFRVKASAQTTLPTLSLATPKKDSRPA